MNQIKLTGQGTEVVVARDVDGHEYLRIWLDVQTAGVIEVSCDDPLIINRFRCYDVRRILFVVGELRFRNDGPYVAASVVEYARTLPRQPHPGFRPFNTIRMPAGKFARR